ncbi:hypothetical protein [Chroococcidiopsis sp. TS-821]|uniref:hypothetical protein n=1 Tax=Chroococcidiopsis sp. TS-821 TaxID=1378066 RepID=UPI0011AFFD5C|nr:hypothetical protein [Chroococcidiopsis sp. TS-821]
MSKKISSLGLSAKQVQELIQSSDWSINNDLTTRLPADIYINAVYSHPDGRTLTVLKDGAGRLYNFHEDWLSHLASLEHLQHSRTSTYSSRAFASGTRFRQDCS